MKLLGWALGALFTVWLASFVSIKIYDLGCVANPSICVTETLIWLRKLVLLEWASKWQTLLAGVGAIFGGAFVIFAGKEQIKHMKISKRDDRIEDALNSFTVVGSYYAEYLRNLEILNSPPKPIPLPSPDLMKDVNFICPDLGLLIFYFETKTRQYYELSGDNLLLRIKPRKQMIAQSICMFEIFKQITHYALDKDAFVPRINLDFFGLKNDAIQEAAIKHKFKHEDLRDFGRFFKVEQTQPVTAPPFPRAP